MAYLHERAQGTKQVHRQDWGASRAKRAGMESASRMDMDTERERRAEQNVARTEGTDGGRRNERNDDN